MEWARLKKRTQRGEAEDRRRREGDFCGADFGGGAVLRFEANRIRLRGFEKTKPKCRQGSFEKTNLRVLVWAKLQDRGGAMGGERFCASNPLGTICGDLKKRTQCEGSGGLKKRSQRRADLG